MTPGLSFAHNLGYRCPNDQHEAILDIYISRPFQWHQEHCNARCFGLCCRTLNIRESRRTPSPQLWECEFHPHTWQKWGCDTYCLIVIFVMNLFYLYGTSPLLLKVIILTLFNAACVAIILTHCGSKFKYMINWNNLTSKGVICTSYFSIMWTAYLEFHCCIRSFWSMINGFYHFSIISSKFYFGFIMMDYHIPYNFLNVRTFHKNMVLLFVKATMVGCWSGLLIHALNKSTPYLLFR